MTRGAVSGRSPQLHLMRDELEYLALESAPSLQSLCLPSMIARTRSLICEGSFGWATEGWVGAGAARTGVSARAALGSSPLRSASSTAWARGLTVEGSAGGTAEVWGGDPVVDAGGGDVVSAKAALGSSPRRIASMIAAARGLICEGSFCWATEPVGRMNGRSGKRSAISGTMMKGTSRCGRSRS